MKWVTEFRPGRRVFRTLYLKAALNVVGRLMRSMYITCDAFKKEIDALPDPFTVSMRVHPFGPSLNLERRGNSLGRNSREGVESDLSVIFRTSGGALKIFTFASSIHETYAREGIAVSGDLKGAMAIMRSVACLEAYLLPEFMTKKILKRIPKIAFWERARTVFSTVLIAIFS